MPRAKTNQTEATTATITESDESKRRPVTWYAERLDTAEALTYGRMAQYRKSREEFDKLVGNHPDRARIFQVFERAALLFVRMNEATEAESDARRQYERRLAEDVTDPKSETESESAEALANVESEHANGKAPVAV